ncbi:MAG: hypothetical protein Q4G50_12980 [Corynebacterium sp.]|uniref:hypothetical protein n=1 Tax=Corynebacterium sp. TaxID=1720 RepID=UPI0026E0303B|nr:hypothetical protein [Corynebacterium sp.]MDO5670897.1 hypothetical protein [Corynebacterium sp.]
MRWAPLWAGVLIGVLLWPLFLPGQLALRDMLVLDSPALSAGALGVGDLPARNAPQDGLLALAGQVLPASWVARALLLAGAVAGCYGAVLLARHQGGSRLSTLTALTLTLWNPFTVERLLQGHWSLVIAGWLLPLIAACGLSGRTGCQWLAVWAASLTPTGAVFALFTAVATARHRLATLAFSLACTLPWLVPGLLGGSSVSAASVAAFAPRAEGFVGTAGAILGLGGIWNADAVPASREAGFAVFGVLLFAVLATRVRQVPGPLLVLAALGLGGALFSWLLPEAFAFAVTQLPGAGLLRDASKLTVLALPAYVAAVASISRFPAALIALILLQVPDAPRALAPLAPHHIEVDAALVERVAGRDTLLVDQPPLTYRPGGQIILNPLLKALPTVESGMLTVDGVIVDAPSPRWMAATEAWEGRDLGRLEELGIGVIVDGEQIVETAAPPQPRALGLALLLGWLAMPLVAVGVRKIARR